MKFIKRIIIKWAIKKIKSLPDNLSFGQLEKYGIADVMKNEVTNENMYIFD